MEKLKSINWGFVIAIILWCVITLIRVFNHSPWYDEAHAWAIAQDLNFVQIIQFMRTEGHTFLWYLLLMPFAKTNFMYPYSMTLLNWFFCFVAIVILWLRAPFNNWVKFFISFSFPFLGLFPIVARCYSIGIMLLFILISMDKIKLNHPNWYAVLLILLANTSLMGTIPATVLGVRFACEMVKNKQKILVPFSIAIFGAILILVQLLGCIGQELQSLPNQKLEFLFKLAKGEIRFNILYSFLIVDIISFILACIYWIKNKIFPVFFIGSIILITILFANYAGQMWHLFFVLIYFICSCWLVYDNLKYKKLLLISLVIVLLPWMFYIPIPQDQILLWSDNKGDISNEILKDNNLKNSRIIITKQFDTSMQPYLKNSGVSLINYCSNEILTYDANSYKNSEKCGGEVALSLDKIVLDKEVFDKWYNGNLYLLTNNKIKLNDFLGYRFLLYKDFGRNYLWKIEKD